MPGDVLQPPARPREAPVPAGPHDDRADVPPHLEEQAGEGGAYLLATSFTTEHWTWIFVGHMILHVVTAQHHLINETLDMDIFSPYDTACFNFTTPPDQPNIGHGYFKPT